MIMNTRTINEHFRTENKFIVSSLIVSTIHFPFALLISTVLVIVRIIIHFSLAT